MTPRKELFIEIQKKLKPNSKLELVDLYRKQFEREKENHPTQFTAVLIKTGTIRYETLTEHIKEGDCEIDVLLYCKDGWLDQHQNTTDPENGLIEIDLIDEITDALEFLKGDCFKPLELINEEENEITEDDIMSYRLTFKTRVYKRINYPYTKRKITIT